MNRDIRYVVIHSPGARWKPGAPIFEQEGAQVAAGLLTVQVREWRVGMKAS